MALWGVKKKISYHLKGEEEDDILFLIICICTCKKVTVQLMDVLLNKFFHMDSEE